MTLMDMSWSPGWSYCAPNKVAKINKRTTDASALAAAIAVFGKSKDFDAAAQGLIKSLGYSTKFRLSLGREDIQQYLRGGLDGYASKGVDFTSGLLVQVTSQHLADSGVAGVLKSPELGNIDSYFFMLLDMGPGVPASLTRSELASIVRQVNKALGSPVILFVRQEGMLHVGHVTRRMNRRDATASVLNSRASMLMRIDCESPHAAHSRILASIALPSLGGLAEIRSMDDLHKAIDSRLSVQALNSKFYGELSNWFHWASGAIRLPRAPLHLQGQDAKTADLEGRKLFTVRLLCRVILCWFLKEKGLVPEQLLRLSSATGTQLGVIGGSKADKTFRASSLYYKSVLQNLFFKGLGCPHEKRREYFEPDTLAENKTVAMLKEVPFMGGGLLDPQDDDHVGSSDADFKVPNILFYATEEDGEKVTIGKDTFIVKGLNIILDSYKYTVSENTPTEEEVALDPELLGLIFENLLAELDVSDEGASKSARKKSGSFYTPRKIIDYMVGETLRLHLEGRLAFEKDKALSRRNAIRSLLQHKKFDVSADVTLNAEIVDSLAELRVLDPACGSGAFPMGMLHRIAEILSIVDPTCELWRRKLSTFGFTSNGSQTDAYLRKIGVIRLCLYGVDIQPMAVLLTKLRFFISLVAEQDVTDGINRGITPFPNLETNIICADTLKSVNVSLDWQLSKDAYLAKRAEFYEIGITEKRRNGVAKEIAETLSSFIPDFAIKVTGRREGDPRKEQERNKKLIEAWFRDASLPAPFFSAEVFFPEALSGGRGFDIVIGNPPYGGFKIDDNVRSGLGLGSNDPYGAFVSRFIKNDRLPADLIKGGLLSFIVSDTFLTLGSHLELRKQLMDSRIHKVIQTSADTFNAAVNTAIVIIQKGGGPGLEPAGKDFEHLKDQDGLHWSQMVDLTQVSIHEDQERFLKLLFDTSGDPGRQISTPSCGVYAYPQALISNNSNYPFFVGSPRLFALMRNMGDNGWEIISGKKVSFRNVNLGRGPVKVVQIGQVAKPYQGLATGDNASYLFQERDARGSYRDISGFREFLLNEDDLLKISIDPDLREAVSNFGISKKGSNSSRYFGGRYIIPYDKGGESDSEEGWLPNYFVPTQYYIDWSDEAVKRIKTLTIFERNRVQGKPGGDDTIASRFQNAHTYFKPGITYSPIGRYAPTYRVHEPSVYDKDGSAIFAEGVDSTFLLGSMVSTLHKYLQKTFVNHTVASMQGAVAETPFILFHEPRVNELVNRIIDQQKANRTFDYGEIQEELDQLFYNAAGLSVNDVSEVKTWYRRRYPNLFHKKRDQARSNVVFCDESRHLPDDSSGPMVIGAVQCASGESESAASIAAKLKELKARHGFPPYFEIKWTKVSPAKVDFYMSALELILESPITFTAIVASDRPNDRSVHDDWYYDTYFELLKAIIDPYERYDIYLDIKDTRGSQRIKHLRQRLSDAHFDYTQSIIRKIQLLRSEEGTLSQVSDFLTGLVSSAVRGSVSNPAKRALIKALESMLGHGVTAQESRTGDKVTVIRKEPGK
ncbi:MAG: BREX-1 system adenine-specific DNA-methyltransferase PglX [Opitutales bacterium]|nr:BREX-1 system adenine-specific DNA-methyltransferase PglX [Opitutales bacterium]